jgi:hypothetical protein
MAGKKGDVLEVVAVAPTGREVMRWSWPLRKTGPLGEGGAKPQPVAGNLFHIKAGDAEWRFSEKTGHLLESTAGLGNGPVPYAATDKGAVEYSSDWHVTSSRKGGVIIIESKNQKDGSFFKWTVSSGGVVSLDYAFAPGSDALAYCAVGFDLDEKSVGSKRWMGDRPFRVWGNRRKGSQFGLWENEYNDGIAGESWELPEFKGIFSNVDWMRFDLKNGGSLLLETDYANVGVLRPKNGAAPKKANMDYPNEGGLFVFHKVPSVGTKFHHSAGTGPQSEPERLNGTITGRVEFRLTDQDLTIAGQ